MKRRAAVSIAELLADGVPVHPAEAVAIIRRLCTTADDEPPRVSHPTEIVLLADGELLTGTGRERHLPAAAVLATLLRALLDRAPLGHRAPAELEDVIARSLGVLPADGDRCARALAAALQPFEGTDPRKDLRALFARWRAVSDLGSDLPDAGQTVQLVLLEATQSARRSVLVPKPDRRRYERVALAGSDAPEAVLRLMASPPRWREVVIARTHDIFVRAHDRRRARELALAAGLLVAVVPTGWWLAGSYAARPVPVPVHTDGSEAHAAIRELEPAVSPELLGNVTPELISTHAGADTAAIPNYSLAKSLSSAPDLLVPDLTAFSQTTTTKPARPVRRFSRPVPSAFWFPDGKRIGYNRGRVLEIVDVKSGRSKAFSTPRRSRIGTMAISPDGRRIVFNAGREGAWLLDLSKGDRQQLRRLVADSTVRSFVWSPDGKRIAYYSRRKGDWQVIQR